MGIKNLLPELKKCTNHVHISQFRGRKVGVDAFTWLHKAAFSCARELFHDPSTTRIIPFLSKRLKLLRDNNLEPIFVFDGKPLPIKAGTDAQRRVIRENAKQQILRAEREGKNSDLYNQAISIHYETVLTFINFLKKNNIQYIVAPYEADAQLAYLAKQNIVDLVLTEDSDLLVYGTPQVLFKLNDEGYVDSIKYQDAINLLGFNNYDEFLTFCVLTGCDYAEHIKMMGVKTALNYVHNFKNFNAIFNQVKQIPKFKIPQNYERQFEKAFLTFKHQKVYDINRQMIVPFTPTDRDLDYAGKYFNGNELRLHVTGAINPHHYGQNEDAEEEEIEFVNNNAFSANNPHFHRNNEEDVYSDYYSEGEENSNDDSNDEEFDDGNYHEKNSIGIMEYQRQRYLNTHQENQHYNLQRNNQNPQQNLPNNSFKNNNMPTFMSNAFLH